MEKEFNLSDKIWKNSSLRLPENIPIDVLPVEDVKEFIRLLKDVIKDYDCSYEVERDVCFLKIDKLAGDRLK